MSRSDTLTGYLHDHLAALVTASRLAEHHIPPHDGTRLACCLRDLLRDLKDDQALLYDLLRRIGPAESLLERARAWVLRRLGRGHSGEGFDGVGGLTLIETLEVLTLALHGRVVLWASLQAISPAYRAFSGIDFLHLKRCAEEERDRLEQHRLEAVYAEFGVPLDARFRMGLELETSQAC